MDENLNAALDSLGMLAAVTNARKDYLAERRCRTYSLQGPPWSKTSGGINVPTKENRDGLEKTWLYSTVRERLHSKRARARCLPYDVRRRIYGMNSSTSASTSYTGGSCAFVSTIITSTATTSHFKLVESAHSQELKVRKTEKFPVPVLLRSKSLEDLRNTATNSQGYHQFQNLDNFIDFGSLGVKKAPSMKTEIDSMSMRIEKLDVA